MNSDSSVLSVDFSIFDSKMPHRNLTKKKKKEDEYYEESFEALTQFAGNFFRIVAILH